MYYEDEAGLSLHLKFYTSPSREAKIINLGTAITIVYVALLVTDKRTHKSKLKSGMHPFREKFILKR
jgi:hypothetical protein